MRISDWSSDVCSSDLHHRQVESPKRMPATPAWPPQSAPRLYVAAPLGQGAMIPLDGNQAHYLISVMRVKEGAIILPFANRTGALATASRKIRHLDLAFHLFSQTKPLANVQNSIGIPSAQTK